MLTHYYVTVQPKITSTENITLKCTQCHGRSSAPLWTLQREEANQAVNINYRRFEKLPLKSTLPFGFTKKLEISWTLSSWMYKLHMVCHIIYEETQLFHRVSK
jgi:hypothetical protein